MNYNQGSNNPMFGKKHSAMTKAKMAARSLGFLNSQWKGDSVGYLALHDWVIKHKGQPTTCEHCGKTGLIGQKINWANKSGRYIRELTDWIRLCVKCHRAFDKARLN